MPAGHLGPSGSRLVGYGVHLSDTVAPETGSKRSSLAFKLTLLCVAGVIGALTLTMGLFQWQDWASDRADLVATQLATGQRLALAASQAAQTRDPRDLERLQAIFEADEEALALRYTPSSGQPLVITRPGESLLVDDAASSAPAQYRQGRLEVRVAAETDGRRVGDLVLVASQDDIWGKLIRNCAVALGLALLSAAAAGWAARSLVRNALRPLEVLEEAMAQVGYTKDFSVTVESSRNDELGRVTRDFNRLLGELRTYDSHLQAAMSDLTAAKDAADEANVMKSQFLANMSHEIRTPLNGVLGMAQVMAMQPLSPSQKERLDVIQKSGVTLLAVLNDLLDLSKIEVGAMELEQAAFDIEDVASGAYSTFTSIANTAGVFFSLIISPEAGGRWEGDSVRLRQVLYNLISNALKFTSEGQVEVCIDAVQGAGGKTLAITVRDTGIGISAEALPKLFEKFVQADNTMTRRFGGTGLGLTISRHMVELMGGAITVESTLGKGSVFHVTLPLPWLGPSIRLPSPPSGSEAAGARGFEGLRVLAAEDNVTNQLVLKTILHSLGLDPVIVENGRLAIEAWRREAFDIILMDIQMPVMDGVAATQDIRRIEAEEGLARTAIVALSANSMKHQVDEYLGAGLDAHLAKPIEIDKLYAVLEAARAGDLAAEDASRVALSG
jgi:signal transduction histidine kinase/ActR/RegA family two-component response regulator